MGPDSPSGSAHVSSEKYHSKKFTLFFSLKAESRAKMCTVKLC